MFFQSNGQYEGGLEKMEEKNKVNKGDQH